jgi:hypothetical protein
VKRIKKIERGEERTRVKRREEKGNKNKR